MSNYILKGDGKWYDKKSGLPKEPMNRGIVPGEPCNAGPGSKLTPNQLLGLQLATGNPLIGKQVTTKSEVEAMGLTFATRELKAPSAGPKFDKFRKENMRKTFVEAEKAASAIPADIGQKLKEGYRLVEDGRGGFTLEKPPPKHSDLLPSEPDGVEYAPEDGAPVEGYDETQPMVDMAYFERKAKEDALGRRSARKSQGSPL